GVGAFLNVHEGPNGISKRVHEPLELGMVTSVEPGFYEPGWGGIRLENLYTVVDVSASHPSNGAGGVSQWYGLESLTFIPFDRKLIDFDRLEPRQAEWLQNYHKTIFAKLSPTLTSEEIQWLQTACGL
ncbi:MAG: M24 family metallopeptidase C-terminal domain-containing protein, partial [Leptolyngbyaceae cyanobacterium bins.59]|nr:M24 family metallopeptidase C-terminal domain-containing protein [Leptolyngbyaceae cyanobacterium bins.59]